MARYIPAFLAHLFFLALLAGPIAGPAHAKPPSVRLVRAWIALGAGGKVPSDAVLRVKKGSTPVGYLVVEARVNGKRRVFVDSSKLRRGRRRLRGISRWPTQRFGALDIQWFKLEPSPLPGGVYDNTGTMERLWHPIERQDHPKKWHWCTPEYAESKLHWGSVWRHALDAHPTTTHDYGGLGTMRFTVRVRLGAQERWSPGKERMDKGGLKAGIATLQVRRDNTDVGYMTELLNVPYVYGSSSASGRLRDHQTERAVGADCADLVVYGWRRAGRRKQKYTWTGGLKGLSRRKAWVRSLEHGRYRRGNGRPLKFGRDIRVGDLLLWGRHVAVIATRDPSGYFTPDTEIVHTVVESSALIPLKKIGFGFDTPPFELRRPRWRR